jgi:hypothetical protein
MKTIKIIFFVVWGSLYFSMLFLLQPELIFWLNYLFSLIAIIFWRGGMVFPFMVIASIPIFELYIIYRDFGVENFLDNIKQFSTFCRLDLFGYCDPLFFILILPLLLIYIKRGENNIYNRKKHFAF